MFVMTSLHHLLEKYPLILALGDITLKYCFLGSVTTLFTTHDGLALRMVFLTAFFLVERDGTAAAEPAGTPPELRRTAQQEVITRPIMPSKSTAQNTPPRDAQQGGRTRS